MPQAVSVYTTQIITGLGLIVLQSTILTKLGHPNLILILILHLAGAGRLLTGGLIAFGLGLVQDTLSGATTGLSSLVYLTIYLCGKIVQRGLQLGHPIHQVTAVLLAGAFHQLVMARFSAQGFPYSSDWLKIALTAALSPFVFRAFIWLESFQIKYAGTRKAPE